MAIKEPVKTIEEAFNNSCKKNGICVRKKKSNKKSMPILDENGDVYILSEDLTIKKKGSSSSIKKVRYPKADSSLGNAKVLSTVTLTKDRKATKKRAKPQETKELVKV